MGILTVDYSERVKKIEEDNAMLKDKLKRRGVLIADLRFKIKELKKKIWNLEDTINHCISETIK